MDGLYLKYVVLMLLVSTIGLLILRLMLGEFDAGFGYSVAIMSACVSGRWSGAEIKKSMSKEPGSDA